MVGSKEVAEAGTGDRVDTVPVEDTWVVVADQKAFAWALAGFPGSSP